MDVRGAISGNAPDGEVVPRDPPA